MAGQWSAFPPEVNAGQLMAGDSGASIAAAAAAYEALAAALTAEGAKMAATAGVTASTGWVGVGGTAMMATAMPYVAALQLLAAWVHQSAATAAAMEQAYVTAKTAMVPVPVCTSNRATWTGLALTNFCGINFPPMGFLDALYEAFWDNNAGHMGGYEAIITALIASILDPPPPAPMTANPAGPAGQAAAISQAAASGAASAAMSQSLNGVNQASSAVQPGAQAAAAPADSMAQMAPQMMSQLGQLPQMAAQPLQMLGQFPQMLGQMPQMAMGMLGPLSQGMGQGGIGGAGIDKVGQLDQATLAATTDAAARGGGGGGGAGGLGSGAGVMSSFTRPTGSFNAPGPPKLPTGWTPGAGVPEVATSAGPATGGGTGGLYGAPAAAGAAGHMGRDERGRDGSAEGRTMQLTVGPRSGRED
jgi:PPE-repeat protein